MALFICHWDAHFLSTICYIFILPKTLELGHSKSYIQSITSGKSKPSTQELFNIADYFNMSLSEFFDEENVESPTVQKAIDAIRKLSEQDAALALAMIQRLSLPLREGGAEQ